MALDIFILSVLRAEPVHGYELKRRVQRPSLTALSNNSLYPILRRFEEAGAVTVTVEEQDGKPARKVYAITDVGRQLLTNLISVLPPELAANEEEFLLRLGFFSEILPEQRAAILDARGAALDASASQVRELVHADDTSEKWHWRNLAMAHLLARIETERRFLADLTKKADQ
jgi:DNA-binding PadR family transcriptional regulator